MITFSNMKEIRWGIIGPGSIAGKFANDLNLVEGATIEAVASRSLDRSKNFAIEYGAKNAYGSYEELFASDSVDVVYVATPHVFHKNLTIQAMQNGKHVLCEKPLGVNLAEVEEMLQVAQENKVFLMEALWSRFNPSIAEIKNRVQDGHLGKLRYINADFAFYAMNRDVDSRLLNPDLAGGSLLDIGIYPVFLSYLLLGMPKNIEVKAKLMSNGLEIQTAMLFEYEEAYSVLYSGLTHKSRMSAEITGERGSFYIDPRWHEADGYEQLIDGDTIKIDLPKLGNGYVHEIEEVHKCLIEGKLQSDSWSHADSLNLISLLDEIRNQTSIQFPFEQD